MASSSTMKSNTMKRLVQDLSPVMGYTIQLSSCHHCCDHYGMLLKKKKSDLGQACKWNIQLLLWWRSAPFTSQSVSNAVLHSLMETSFMADSKCVCGAARSSVREISSKQMAAAFSTNTMPRLTFYGEISPPSTFNHPSSFSVCVCPRSPCARMPRVAPNLLISRPTEAVSFFNPVLCSAILT